MKKILAFILMAVLCLSMVACGNNTYTRIGTSEFSIILPEGYVATKDNMDEDQIAYYFKDAESIDFDIYQWEKEARYTLKDEAEYYAAEYGTVAEEIEINGIKGMKYVSIEDFEGYEYTVVNYMFEDKKNIVEFCFWTVDTEEDYKAVNEIIGTIKK